MNTTAVLRGLIVFAVSAALGAVLWFVADTVGQPTPIEMVPGLYQPAIVGLKHTIEYLAVGTVLWLLWAGFARVVGIGRSKRR